MLNMCHGQYHILGPSRQVDPGGFVTVMARKTNEFKVQSGDCSEQSFGNHTPIERPQKETILNAAILSSDQCLTILTV